MFYSLNMKERQIKRWVGPSFSIRRVLDDDQEIVLICGDKAKQLITCKTNSTRQISPENTGSWYHTWPLYEQNTLSYYLKMKYLMRE